MKLLIGLLAILIYLWCGVLCLRLLGSSIAAILYENQMIEIDEQEMLNLSIVIILYWPFCILLLLIWKLLWSG